VGDFDVWDALRRLLMLNVWEPMERMDEPYFRG
jgi:hypothetical protein